jgi:hypothetical protein
LFFRCLSRLAFQFQMLLLSCDDRGRECLQPFELCAHLWAGKRTIGKKDVQPLRIELFSSTSPIDGGLVHRYAFTVYKTGCVGGVICRGRHLKLEDVFQIDTASSLWSSEALAKNPQSVINIEAHLMFLRAGARLIETAS